MTNPFFVRALVALNCSLLAARAIQWRPASADPVPDVLQAKRMELLDEAGQVRASLKVEEGGDTVFRIIGANGEIRVKLGGPSDGSGLVLMNNQTEPMVHILAKPEETTLTLRGVDGATKTITP